MDLHPLMDEMEASMTEKLESGKLRKEIFDL